MRGTDWLDVWCRRTTCTGTRPLQRIRTSLRTPLKPRTSYPSVRTPSAALTSVSSFSLCCCAGLSCGYLPGLAAG